MVLLRPTDTAWSLLALYVAIATSQVIIAVNDGSVIHWRDSPDGLALLASITAAAVALAMPMRPAILGRRGISRVGEKPTSLLRTPEDDITLWQWMTVSWMAPLISLGNTKQLDENDVWFLGYQFQHRRLHDSFRVLRGSVLRRLLNANGLDLVISSLLGLIELLSCIDHAFPLLCLR